jgi:hypothetical protein
MTIDKETLIKHRFWIALGVFVVLILVAVLLIPIFQGSANAALEKKYQDTVKLVEAIKSPKSEHFRKPLEEKEGELKKHKNIVWEKAWAPQADFMTWPQGGNAQLSEKLSKAYFGDYIAPNDRTEYGAKLYQQYLESLHLPDMVKPVEFERGWEDVIRPVAEWDVNRTPTIEEIWLAQEDLWVKRELLSIIRETLDSVRIFHKVKVEPPKDAKAPPANGAAEPLVLRNANWELSLVLEPDPKNSGGIVISNKSTLKNINPWKRTLTLADVPFRIGQGEGNYFDFSVDIDSVPANETVKFPQPIPFKLRALPDQELKVEQILTWQTSPIKRIDRIALYYNSHRTANRTVKAKLIGPQDDKKDKPAETSQPATGSTQAMMMGSNMMPGGGAVAGGGKTINKYLQRERYLDFTDQVRWMPVGMVLIVDQEYMQDLQVAVANSRLRIQPTQIAYHRAHGVRSSITRDGKTGDIASSGQTTQPTIGEGTIGGRGGSSAGRPPTSITTPRTGSGPISGAMNPSAANEEDPNLVEFSIYGIASLYERFPPKPTNPKP